VDELSSGYEIIGSLDDYERFIASRIWEDMKTDLGIWRLDMIEQLKVAEGNELYRYQGRLQLLDEVLKWPEKILELLKEDLEREMRNG
jgi:hypothetical protein